MLLADKDHVFFEYTAKETSEAVRLMFQGYDGYVQADAKSVYDVLFREPGDNDAANDQDDGAPRPEWRIWGHCRRRILGGHRGQERRRPERPGADRPGLRARRLLACRHLRSRSSASATRPSAPPPRRILQVGS